VLGLARRQHGVVSTPQVLALGLDKQAIHGLSAASQANPHAPVADAVAA
jgi:hypothetical protein